jgi:hypothetical protein
VDAALVRRRDDVERVLREFHVPLLPVRKSQPAGAGGGDE